MTGTNHKDDFLAFDLSVPEPIPRQWGELYYCPHLTALREFPGYDTESENPGEV